MKINGHEVKAKRFAFDGCHKIYLLESKEDVKSAKETGYTMYPIKMLEETYEDSCGLRFISNWSLTTNFVHQFEDAVFTKE